MSECRGCWRAVETTTDHGWTLGDAEALPLCSGCRDYLRLVAPGGLDGSEGARLARRMLGVWSDPVAYGRRLAEVERRAAEAEARAAEAVAATVVEA